MSQAELILYAMGQGILLSFMIGPVFFLLIETSISKGARAAFIFDLGVVLADFACFAVAYYGSRDLLMRVKDHPSLLFLGGLVLLVYGISQWIFAGKMNGQSIAHLEEKTNYFGLFMKGILFNLLNIGVLFFWIGVVLIVLPNLGIYGNEVWEYMIISMGTFLLVDVVKILLAKEFKKKMTPSNLITFKRFVALALVIFGIVLIIRSLFSFNILFRFL